MNQQITFNVTPCDETGGYVARWDDPLGRGGITTQGDSFGELQDMIRDAIGGFFEPSEAPRRVKIHFVEDPMLQIA